MRKSLAEIFEDEPEAFDPASVIYNLFKDFYDIKGIDLREYQVRGEIEKKQIEGGYSCVEERVKNLRQRFSEAVITARRSGSG